MIIENLKQLEATARSLAGHAKRVSRMAKKVQDASDFAGVTGQPVDPEARSAALALIENSVTVLDAGRVALQEVLDATVEIPQEGN